MPFQTNSSQSAAGIVANIDPIWKQIRDEAEEIVRREPVLGGYIYSAILNHDQLERAVVHRISERLHHRDLSGELIAQAFLEALASDPGIAVALRADIVAIYDRDPACNRLVEPVLNFKGFHATQTSRLSSWLWKQGRRDFAFYLQSRASAAFGVDIHPAAGLGKGLLLDHATAIVIGETAVVEDDVSILHGVTLGGNGKDTGDRHPKVRHGVLIGAGAQILGNIEIGHCSRVAAGSVVLADVPPCKTVAGVPANVVGEAPCAEPSRSMDHLLGMSSE